MNCSRVLRQLIGGALAVLSLAGCVTAAVGPSQPGQPTVPTSTCRGDEVSPTAVLRSTDHGETWTKLGRLCMHDASILSVDFTAVPTAGGGIALYFIDMKLLGQAPSVQRLLYRATSMDGLNFDKPQAVVTSNVDMFDPTVVRTAEGRIRLYVPMAGFALNEGVASFVSDDGLNFVREAGVRNVAGGMPGGLVLPDHRVRMFVQGVLAPNQPGIISYISDDGLTFTIESGVRIAATGSKTTEMPFDASPIRLIGGGYLMAFAVNPTDPPVPAKGEYRLATSEDGFNWVVKPTVFAEGGTSCLVETSDGTLFFYYGI